MIGRSVGLYLSPLHLLIKPEKISLPTSQKSDRTFFPLAPGSLETDTAMVVIDKLFLVHNLAVITDLL